MKYAVVEVYNPATNTWASGPLDDHLPAGAGGRRGGRQAVRRRRVGRPARRRAVPDRERRGDGRGQRGLRSRDQHVDEQGPDADGAQRRGHRGPRRQALPARRRQRQRGALPTAESYDPATDAWTAAALAAGPVQRRGRGRPRRLHLRGRRDQPRVAVADRRGLHARGAGRVQRRHVRVHAGDHAFEPAERARRDRRGHGARRAHLRHRRPVLRRLHERGGRLRSVLEHLDRRGPAPRGDRGRRGDDGARRPHLRARRRRQQPEPRQRLRVRREDQHLVHARAHGHGAPGARRRDGPGRAHLRDRRRRHEPVPAARRRRGVQPRDQHVGACRLHGDGPAPARDRDGAGRAHLCDRRQQLRLWGLQLGGGVRHPHQHLDGGRLPAGAAGQARRRAGPGRAHLRHQRGDLGLLPERQRSRSRAYDVAAGTWSAVAAIPSPRESFAAATGAGPKGLVYAIAGGGFNAPPIASVAAYDTAANAW